MFVEIVGQKSPHISSAFLRGGAVIWWIISLNNDKCMTAIIKVDINKARKPSCLGAMRNIYVTSLKCSFWKGLGIHVRILMTDVHSCMLMYTLIIYVDFLPFRCEDTLLVILLGHVYTFIRPNLYIRHRLNDTFHKILQNLKQSVLL